MLLIVHVHCRSIYSISASDLVDAVPAKTLQTIKSFATSCGDSKDDCYQQGIHSKLFKKLTSRGLIRMPAFTPSRLPVCKLRKRNDFESERKTRIFFRNMLAFATLFIMLPTAMIPLTHASFGPGKSFDVIVSLIFFLYIYVDIRRDCTSAHITVPDNVPATVVGHPVNGVNLPVGLAYDVVVTMRPRSNTVVRSNTAIDDADSGNTVVSDADSGHVAVDMEPRRIDEQGNVEHTDQRQATE